MNSFNMLNKTFYRNFLTAVLTMIFSVGIAGNALALKSVNVMDSDGNPIGVSFKWLVEEDQTYHVPLKPNGRVFRNLKGKPLLDPNWKQKKTLSTSFHQSYMPVVAEGTDADLKKKLKNLKANKNYFISVLPEGGYALGGAPFKGSDKKVDVYVNTLPIPTAQITIFVHEDISPINAVWDDGEQGLPDFQVVVEDAGGKYGASAGIQSANVYGDPLCSVYLQDGDGNYLDDNMDGLPDRDPLSPALCTTGPDGRLIIRDISPGKYGVIVIPPNAVVDPDNPGAYVGADYIQTSTIEGTRLVDAWVKANEPNFFGEFGPPGPHVSIGFVPAGPNAPYADPEFVNAGGNDISGRVVNMHLSRPPDQTLHAGGPFPHTTPWVGLNLAPGGMLGRGVYAARTVDGEFTIPAVAPGQYQLVVWDDNLDLVFGQASVTVDGAGDVVLGDVPVFQWFTRMEHFVYQDLDGNGVFDDTDTPLPEQAVLLRFRDGTIYQELPTDTEGFSPFDEAFPFFNWLVTEVDFGRFKATGATITVDDGGAIDSSIFPPGGTDWTFGDQLNPQVQGTPNDPDSVITTDFSRREEGPVLTQAFQGFLGQTSVIKWSKEEYMTGENGGISGMVLYAVTRAEDNPELAATEPWEPGIPRVKVQLWDSETYYGWLDGSIKKSKAKPLMTTKTDSWDDSLPENCQYGANAGSGTDDPYVYRGKKTDCFDGMRNWNQVRPGVFDGGFAFGPQFDRKDFKGKFPAWIEPSASDPKVGYMIPGDYVVRVIPPTGYQVIRSESKNVDFGEEYVQPAPQLLPSPCVGEEYVVPPTLTLFPGVDATLAGQTLNSCQSKEVSLSPQQNAAVEFHLFTEVPIAGHIKGAILDDTANEFDPASPQFGEKYAPPFLPVSVRDWTGREISRTVSDENGHFNVLVPSTFTQNLGKPSGASPNMLTTCMNAKTKPDLSIDPLHNPQYSQFCYTFQYMPGSTTYLDTPVVPVAAFAGPDQNPVDCELPTKTPRIKSVDVATNGEGGGPYIPLDPITLNVVGRQVMNITSLGATQVPNPGYTPEGKANKSKKRQYGFGNKKGTVTIGGVPMDVKKWTDNSIKIIIPDGFTGFAGDGIGGKQLLVTHNNGNYDRTGVTVQVGLRDGSNVVAVSEGEKIQDAINGAGPNDLILVGPGVYDEMLIMYKPVQLQGWGAGSTFIDAIKAPFDKLTVWRTLAESILDAGDADIIPGQQLGFAGIEPNALFTEEGAGVLVLAVDPVANPLHDNLFSLEENQGARIDGFTISGADTGGGVTVNGYGDYLEISNLKITNNSAFFAGGIRVGHPLITDEDDGGPFYSDAENNNVNIHNNTVVLNGGLDGAGGGVALHTGSDSYQVTHNFVCGNFTNADGAGIAHQGLSLVAPGGPTPLIGYNEVIFNENFNQGIPANGGGIMVAGNAPLATNLDSEGSGSVEILNNKVQGNYAGSGDGGGILLSRVNGADVTDLGGGDFSSTYSIDIINNMVFNNVAALAGGGISIQDALDVTIQFNTIAHNDNSSTAANAFTAGEPNESNPQPGAGVATHAHVDIPLTIGNGYSEPILSDNIIYQNRSFYWKIDSSVIPAITGLCPDIGGSTGLSCDPGPNPNYSDLAVIGIGGTLTCNDCLETGGADPLFVKPGFNGNRMTTMTLNEPGPSAVMAPAALDEGGNFIRLRYGPLTQLFDFHIKNGSPAQDMSVATDIPVDDIDMEIRADSLPADWGADEVQ